MSGPKDINPFAELGYADNEETKAATEPETAPDWDAELRAAIGGLAGWDEIKRSLWETKTETIH